MDDIISDWEVKNYSDDKIRRAFREVEQARLARLNGSSNRFGRQQWIAVLMAAAIMVSVIWQIIR